MENVVINANNIAVPSNAKKIVYGNVIYKNCSNTEGRIWISKDGNSYIVTSADGKIEVARKGSCKGKVVRQPSKCYTGKVPGWNSYSYHSRVTAMHICINGKVWNVGELVLDAWAGKLKPTDGQRWDVDHINTVCWDNRVENLQWLTHAENMKKRHADMGFLF